MADKTVEDFKRENPGQPDWWYELTREIRIQVSGDDIQKVPPLLYLRRLNLTLESNSQQLEERLAHYPSEEGEKRLAFINSLINSSSRLKHRIMVPS